MTQSRSTTQSTANTQSTSTPRKVIAAYKFTGFKFLQPNYSKPGSDKWAKATASRSRDWIGYLTPVGQYWDGELRSSFAATIRNFSGVQVSIICKYHPDGLRTIDHSGRLIAVQHRSKNPEYRYNGVISPVLGGPRRFLDAVGILSSETASERSETTSQFNSPKVRLLDMVANQEPLFQDYTLDEPFKVVIRA